MYAVGTIQRDFFTLLRKGIHKNTIVVNILQLDGSVTRERVNECVFRGYRARRLAMMTNMDGRHTSHTLVTSSPSQDKIIPDFATLRRAHREDMQYRLMPLLCTDYDTFAGLQGICSSVGSPLRICDRFDPRLLTRRFQQNSTRREQICDFFRTHLSQDECELPVAERSLPIVGVQFDGVLLRHAKMTVHHDAVEPASGDDAVSSAGARRGVRRCRRGMSPSPLW